MKRVNLHIALLVLLVAASCTKSEELESSSGWSAIGFDTFVGNSTKAVAESGFSTSDVFVVDAYYTATSKFTDLDINNSALLHMSDELVTASSGSGEVLTWDYLNTAYWPKSAGEYISFFALSLGDNEGNTTGSVGSVASPLSGGFNDAAGTGLSTISFNYTNPSTAQSQRDLMAAACYDLTNSSSATGVQFSFEHLLTQICFTFGTDQDYSANQTVVRLRSLTLDYGDEGSFWGSGTYTFDNTTSVLGSWKFTTLDVEQADETFSIDTTITESEQGYELSNSQLFIESYIPAIMLIPQGTAKSIGVTLEYSVQTGGSDYAKVVNTYKGTLAAVDYKASSCYTYAVEIGLNEIEFSEAAISDMTQGDTGEIK